MQAEIARAAAIFADHAVAKSDGKDHQEGPVVGICAAAIPVTVVCPLRHCAPGACGMASGRRHFDKSPFSPRQVRHIIPPHPEMSRLFHLSLFETAAASLWLHKIGRFANNLDKDLQIVPESMTIQQERFFYDDLRGRLRTA